MDNDWYTFANIIFSVSKFGLLYLLLRFTAISILGQAQRIPLLHWWKNFHISSCWWIIFMFTGTLSSWYQPKTLWKRNFSKVWFCFLKYGTIWRINLIQFDLQTRAEVMSSPVVSWSVSEKLEFIIDHRSNTDERLDEGVKYHTMSYK